MKKHQEVKQKKLKSVVKAWPDTKQPSITRCWFLELDCGHVIFRPIHEDPPMPPQMALCTECPEHSKPTNPKPESPNHGTETGTPCVSII